MTYPLLLCMTLVVMVSGYERYMPGPSKQLTKADIDYMTDTKTLKAILAKLMKIHVQEDSVVQGTCYSTSNIFGQNYELTSSQINDILGSHTTNSSNVYIILNDGAEFSGSLSREYQWYEELSVDFQSPIVDTPTSVWINKTPCKDCVELLEVTFKDRGRPTIYVESFDYNETDYAQLMKSIGCMAKLEKYNFVVKPWDWTLFSQILDTLNSANTCTASIRTVINSEEYKEKKADFEDFMDLYKELRDNHDLDEWCR